MEPYILKIEASAGAGKTYRLTMRFLELLRTMRPSPRDLRAIVAITFTNKAAAEMKERLVRALKEIALKTPEGRRLSQATGLLPEEARAWLEVIFEHYQDLQVRTIDSLVFSILKGVALELGLRPDLEAELKEDILLNRAYDCLLVALGEGHQELEETFREVLHTFLEIEARGGFYPERKIRATMLALFRYEAKGRALNYREGTTPLKALEEKVKTKAQEFLSAVESCKAAFRYRSWATKFRDPLRELSATPFHKDSVREVLKATKNHETLETIYQAFREALEEYLLVRAIVRLVPYARLYQYLKQELELLRQQEGLIHGGAWVSLVERVLRENGVPLVYCKFGARFRHFLVDEFQDTSRQQWEALCPLVEDTLAQGGTFTYVGDVKQAIYVWRGGDPSLFVEVSRDLPAHLREEPLPYNWRSQKDLVEFNNRFFSLLAREETARWVAQNLLYGKNQERQAQRCPIVAEMARNIAEIFAGARQKLPRSDRSGGRVHLIPCGGETNQEKTASIQEKLKTLLPTVFIRYQERGGRVAVLVRTNDQAEEVARLLFELRIPAVTENALRLASSRLVRGLIALLTFLDYPYHDVALAGFLRSEVAAPYFDAAGFFRKRPKPPLIEAVRKEAPAFWERYLAPLLERAGVLPPYDLVREVLSRFDVYQRFPEEEAFLHRFLSLVLAFEQEGAGLSAFLERWHERGLEERLGLPEEVSAVRVLTIHAAKGLEFEAVFLPYLHWEIKPAKLVTLEDGSLGYVQSPYPQPIRERALRERVFQGLEMLNLLYVAFTRAKEELFLFVPLSEKKSRYEKFGTGDIVYRLLAEAGYLRGSSQDSQNSRLTRK